MIEPSIKSAWGFSLKRGEIVMIDVAAARADTPGCENVLHFNNAGASLPPTAVLERVKRHLDLEAATGGYEAADQTAEEYERVYGSVARMLGCDSNEVALVESATRAWSAAFSAMAQGFRPGDKILTAENEYVSNYLDFLQMARKREVEIVVLPSETNGEISLPAMEVALGRYGPRVKLIALTHVPTNGGLVQPAVAVGRIARAHHVPYLLDACQSVGQIPLNVEELGCDMLSATGRKYLRAPRGTGFLYVSRSLLRRMDLERWEPMPLDMRAATWTDRAQYEIRKDARRFETWESSVACRLGLGVAVEYAMALELEAIVDRVALLAERLREQLARIPGVVVRDLPGGNRCGIVTFTHEQHAAQAIFQRMREQGINVRVTSLGSTRLDMEQRGLTEMVRASVHYYNTEEEIERFAQAIHEL